ncbi:MAG: VOC family protein [candidate division Zixibacteria bacterium]|nr:VOC family protein [candidate division Zixibacteria bacterium]
MLKMFKLSKILETVLYVDNFAATEKFYTEVLGLSGKNGNFAVGEGMLLLFEASKAVKQKSPPPHGATGPGHMAFEVPFEEYERWKKFVAEKNIKIEEEIIWDKDAIPVVRSFYFRDPSGNVLEIATPGIWKKLLG